MFQDAVIREVKEESGLEFEPSTLVLLEFGGGHWYRFTFTGRVTGEDGAVTKCYLHHSA